jgi:hypothetical protein
VSFLSRPGQRRPATSIRSLVYLLSEDRVSYQHEPEFRVRVVDVTLMIPQTQEKSEKVIRLRLLLIGSVSQAGAPKRVDRLDFCLPPS